jgi:hypothetical protein
MGGACSMNGDEKSTQNLVRKPEGQGSLGRLGVDGRMILE